MLFAKYHHMISLKDRIGLIEKEEIIFALMECEWVMARAARLLGITERMIAYKVRKYCITKEVVYHEAEAANN